MTTHQSLAAQFQAAHNQMRNVDGLQPQEAFDELLKYLLFKEQSERSGLNLSIDEALATPAEVASTAAEIRTRFEEYVLKSSVAPANWNSDGFALGDLALCKVHAVFQNTMLLGLEVDLRSSALRHFVTGPIRKGLGIFLTPEEVVRAIVTAIAPQIGESVLDPACGSGTFLNEAAAFARTDDRQLAVHGIDKSPRMLMLADFNFGHFDGSAFNRAVGDSLAPFGSTGLPSWYRANSFDVILTNPPFGVSVDSRGHDFASYTTCLDERGYPMRSQGSEIMFVERCLELLRPGGCLGIVLPRSVLTNNRLQLARERLGRLGAVRAVIALPPETFAATGTQTTTAVLIIEKFGGAFTPKSSIAPVLARVDNVGFDLTGRPRTGSQLGELGGQIKAAIERGKPAGCVQVLGAIEAQSTFARLPQILGGSANDTGARGRTLADLVEVANTGRTPPRSAYADHGQFLVKVGNLTGAGIDWLPRDRNFISHDHSYCRNLNQNRLLRRGDLVLTSSAHASRYIAKKVDIVTRIPDDVGGSAAFVGEVMLLRPKADAIDPFRLLAYLRCESVVAAIQDRVRGQTAHLHSGDLMGLSIDEDLLGASELDKIAALLREEAELSDRLNQLAFEQADLRRSLIEQARALEMAAE